MPKTRLKEVQQPDGKPLSEDARVNAAVNTAMEIQRCASDLRGYAKLFLDEVLNGNAMFEALYCRLTYEGIVSDTYVDHINAVAGSAQKRIREGEELIEKAQKLGIERNELLKEPLHRIRTCIYAIQSGNLLSVRRLLQEKEPT